MKVKELIELLQKENPEDYVRVPGGAIFGLEQKPGYWDGAYQYIDGDELVISTKGSKVDIITMDYQTWIWDHDGDYSKIRLDFPGCEGDTLKGKIDDYLKSFEKVAKEVEKFVEDSTEHSTLSIIKMLQDGWHIREDLSSGRWSQLTMDFVRGDEVERMNIGQCQAVRESGMFIKGESDGKIRLWELKR